MTPMEKLDEIVRGMEDALDLFGEPECHCPGLNSHDDDCDQSNARIEMLRALALARELRAGAVEGHAAYGPHTTRDLLHDGYDVPFYRGTQASCDHPALLIITEATP